jgi:hypothetical protein
VELDRNSEGKTDGTRHGGHNPEDALSFQQACEELADRYSLSFRQRVRLCRTLNHLRAKYAFLCVLRQDVSPAVLSSEARGIERDLARISRRLLGKAGPQLTSLLANSAERSSRATTDALAGVAWALSQAGLTNLDQDTNAALVRAWIQPLPAMTLLSKQVLMAVGGGSGSRSVESVICGQDLPRLYTRLTGKSFGVSRNVDQTLSGPAINFVVRAMQIIGMEATSPETIRTHFRNARRVVNKTQKSRIPTHD